MKEIKLEWKSSDGLKINGICWKPEEKVNALICLIHGHGDHIMRFRHMAAWLSQKGIAIVGMDLRGHGNSEGKRGHIPSYSQLLDDVSQLLIEGEKQFNGIPIFLYGHSMGGNIVANYVLQRTPLIKGAILSGPWLRLELKTSGIRILLGRIMNYIWPGFSQHSKLPTKFLSRDKDIVIQYENDPLVHDKISARLAISIMDQGEWAIKNSSKCLVPLLIMHGANDPICSPSASKEFASGVKSVSVQTNFFAGLFHEIHNEPEKEEVFNTVLGWVKTQTGNV